MSLSRRKERELVFQMLFAGGFGENAPEEIYENFIENLDDSEVEEIKKSDYIKSTFFGAFSLAQESDKCIEESAKGWSKNRISRTARALIMLGMYEIKKTDIPSSIAINEAVELAKQYDEIKVSGFVNAVLGNIAKSEDE